ncbi:MAG: NADH-quinone oxidoreductase subunit M [Ignavibacteria bacterium]|jgi:NADH-quinone oxidoreductase subunit M
MKLLSLLIFLPILLSIPILFFKKERSTLIKVYSLTVAVLELILSVILFINFKEGTSDFQFVEKYQWVQNFNIYYHLGVDGISLLMVALTAFIFPVTIFALWNSIEQKLKIFFFLFLIMEGSLMGVFLSLDLILFYVFWELILIPMYFIIGIWGSANRHYATVKFVLYTMFGSLLMLIAIIWLANYAQPQLVYFTTNYLDLRRVAPFVPPNIQVWMFMFFALSFAIKIPVFPFHTWLPDAHTEAPTAGSVILAAVLLKMGAYGFLRYLLGLFPIMFIKYSHIIAVLGVIGIIYGALLCIAQKDMKKLIAYSSVSHMGFIVLGIAGLTITSLQGSLLQMVNHGLTTGALFLFMGFLYDRRHTREISAYGGLSKIIPVYASLFLVICLSSIGLPGLNGFIGEFLILSGSFSSIYLNSHVYSIIGTIGVILSAVYLLWLYQRLMLGQVEIEENKKLIDLKANEIISVAAILIFVVWIGVFPDTFLKKSEPSIHKIIDDLELIRINMLKFL